MRHLVRIAALALLLTPFAAGEAAAACRHTPGSAAQAACLGQKADRLIARTESRVATAGRLMKGLGERDARAFEAWLRRAQVEWRERTEGNCAAEQRSNPRDPTAGPACRARAAERRSAEIEGWLSGRTVPRR